MRVIKFDILYPLEYLQQKQEAEKVLISQMNFDEYNSWLMDLRMGFYNLFSREMSKRNWEAFDFYFQDDYFVFKLAEKYNISGSVRDFITRKGLRWWKDLSLDRIIKAVQRPLERKQLRKHIILRKFIALYNPDIILLREPCQVDNLFWKPYKNKIFFTTIIGCNVGHPANWQLHTSDMIFTITSEFSSFFNLNNVPSYIFEYGFDTSLLKELNISGKQYEVSFVGLLGTDDQLRKTELMDHIAASCNFTWWGPKGPNISLFPYLEKTWQGISAGKEMYEIYASSKIVINDYVHSNGDSAVNLRLKEALGVGAFMLTRQAENIRHLEKQNILRFYDDGEDCVRKINYYLAHNEERINTANNAKLYFEKNYNYSKILQDLFEVMEKEFGLQKNRNFTL